MKRNYCVMMLMFSALLLIGMGCRRVGAPQSPVEVVNEKDDFVEFSNAALLIRMKPLEKPPPPFEITLTMPLSVGIVQGRLEPSEAIKPALPAGVEIKWERSMDNSDDGMKLQVDRKSTFEKLRDGYKLQQQEIDMLELIKSYTAFIDRPAGGKGPTALVDRHIEGLRKDLRRNKKKDLREKIDRKDFEVVMDVDFAVKTHVIAYRPLAESLGNLTALADGKVVYNAIEDIDKAVKQQQFWLLWKAYLEFCDKTPINQRDETGFKQHMMVNMAPSTLRLVKNRKIAVVIEVEPQGTISFDNKSFPQVFAWNTTEEIIPKVGKRAFYYSPPGERVPKGAQLPPAMTPDWIEQIDERSRLLDSQVRQQLYFAWKACNGYSNSLGGKQPRHDDLRTYLKANTFPSIGKLVEDGKMLLSDPAVKHPYVACFSDPLPTPPVDPTDKKAPPPPPPTYRAIALTGMVTIIDDATQAAVFTKK